jgi:regulator of sigma E protease
MLIVAAGPAANFLLAAVIYWALFLHGMPGVRPVIAEPPAASAVAAAGLVKGDTIERIADEEVRTWEDVNWALLRHVVNGGQIEVFARDELGHVKVHTLRIDKTEGGDLEKDFLPKLGLLPAKFAQPRIGEMQPDSPALEAGLRTGDWVRTVNAVRVADWQALVKEIRRQPEQRLRLEVVRDGKTLDVFVTSKAESVKGEVIGRIGAGAYAFTTVSYGSGRAVGEALRKTWDTSALSLELLWKMVWGEVSWRNLSGPVTIADYAGQTAQMGWMPYLIFLALISTSLGVLNLLPVPVLDGGHLMYYIAETITGRPVSEQVLMLGQRIGMALLFTLMLFALYNDINRLLGP